ncbi:sensor histidine kinase [Dyadobacter sp. UP-52]|uniref:Sensor histidine kinase n=1 Tax=Dyadobacter subterraneus TaxID=2773304 RepID=A0ABR9WEH0_9BACT|nr:sensor histidine kinase [Dyadobacter subterraneus]
MNRIYFSALDVSMIILAFYIFYLYLMPDYFRRKSIWLFAMWSIALILALSGIFSWMMLIFLQHNLVPIHFDFSWNYKDLQLNRLFIVLVGVLGGCSVKLALDRLEAGKKLNVMEKEKSAAELNYLKAQINPHFLFNSLNSLYTQLELGGGDAKATLASIADLLRYQLYDCIADFIAVEKEIAYLRNYFNLQSLRKDNCKTEMLVQETKHNFLIAPLLPIPFIENAFKYVSDSYNQENFIKASITFKEDKLRFHCINTMDVVELNLLPAHDKGIGLVNVQKRLDLIYRNKYELHAGIVNGKYEVLLTLDLT